MDYQEYNVYRGLQKPFILFGLKGINIAWGFGGGIAAMLLFAIMYFVTDSFFFGLAGAVVVAGICIYKINYHNTHGLRNKTKMKGVWVPKNLIKSTFK